MFSFKHLGLLLLAAAGVAAAAATAPVPDSTEFCGTVRTADGKPLAGATLSVSYSAMTPTLDGPTQARAFSASTDARGKFTLPLPRPLHSATLSIEVPANCREKFWRMTPSGHKLRLRLDAETRVEVEIRTEAGVGVLTGKVTDEDANPVKGSAVTISRTDDGSGVGSLWTRQSLDARTDAAGVYRFENLPSGAYSFDSVVPERGSGLVPRPKEWRGHGGARVIRARPAVADFSLKRGALVSGRVVDEAGKPVQGATLRIDRAPAAIDGPSMFERVGNFSDTTKSGADGRFTLVGLSPETYDIRVWPPADSSLAATGLLTGLRLEAGRTFACQDLVLVRGGTLEGIITGTDGKPVADVDVECGPKSAKTDAQGRYRITGLATGLYGVKLTPPKGSTWAAKAPRSVPSLAATALRGDWTLETGGTVLGTVTDEDGKPVAGAAVRAGCGQYVYSTVTDAAGKFVLVGVTPNSGTDYRGQPVVYALGVTPPAGSTCESAGVSFGISTGEKLKQDVTLRTGASLRGEVTDAAGKPVSGASIGVYQDVGRGGRSYFGNTSQPPFSKVMTDEKGAFVVRQLAPGSYGVSAHPPEDANLLGSDARVQVEAGSPANVKLVLKPGATLTGTLTDAAGKPVADADAALTPQGPPRGWAPLPRPVTTDEHGRYRFVGLAGGPYRLEVRIFDNRNVVTGRKVEVKEGAETTEDLRAAEGGFIDVTALDAAGKPIPGASVQANGQGDIAGASLSSYTEKSGRAALGPLFPGTYAVVVKVYRKGPPATVTVNDVVVKSGERVAREIKFEGGNP
jgi:protocatechuate 3,4-dioxygenase beta subunit